MLVNRAPPPPPTPPPRFGKFSSTARCKALQSLYCTIRRLFVLFVDYSRTIRTIRRLFADYSHYSSTIRRLFVLFVDYSHYSHYSLHYSSFINCHQSRQVNMIFKYKIHYKFYCLVYFIMIYLLYTDTRLGRLWLVQIRLYYCC